MSVIIEGLTLPKHNPKEIDKNKKRKREYFRKCGVCGRRFNQKDMIRDDCSDNGWICTDCHNDEYHDQEIDDF